MPESAIATWGSFLSGLGTLIIALIGAAILGYDVRLRKRQLRETDSRSYAALNVDFQVVASPKFNPNSQIPTEWIIESRVILKNVSSEIYAVPAAYISARSLPDVSVSDRPHSFSERDFNSLQSIDELSEPLNVAWFPSSIWHLGPGEQDSVVRWDVVPADFIRRHSTLVVKVLIYSVPNQFIGAAFSGDAQAGSARSEWIEFMSGDENARQRKIIFSYSPGNYDFANKGAWVLLKPNTDEIDTDASRRFRKLLDGICLTGRQILMTLDHAATSSSAKRRATLDVDRDSS